MPVLDGSRQLFKIFLYGSIAEQETLNRYWYITDSAPAFEPILSDVADAFGATVLEELVDLVTTGWIAESLLIEKYQIAAPVAVFERLYSGINGTLTGDNMPYFNAVGFKLGVETRETRPGSKRYAGMLEEQQNNNLLTVAAQSAWSVMNAAHIADLVPGVADAIHPVIIRDVVYPFGERTPLPITEWVWNPINNSQLNPNVRSQVSRRRP